MFSTKPHAIHLFSADESGPVIATAHPASRWAQDRVLMAITNTEGSPHADAFERSEFMWLRLADGEVWLATYPSMSLVESIGSAETFPMPGVPVCDVPDLPWKSASDLTVGDVVLWADKGATVNWVTWPDPEEDPVSVTFTQGGVTFPIEFAPDTQVLVLATGLEPKTPTEAAQLVPDDQLERELHFAEACCDENDPRAVEWRDALRARSSPSCTSHGVAANQAAWMAAPDKLAKRLSPGDHIYWNGADDREAEVMATRFGLGGISQLVITLRYRDAAGVVQREQIEWDADDEVKMAVPKRSTLATLGNAPEMAPAEVPDLCEFDTAKPINVWLGYGSDVVVSAGWTNTNVGIHGRRGSRLTFIPWAQVARVEQDEG